MLRELEILSAIGSRRGANRAAAARPIRAGARPFTEQDAIPNLDVDRDELAALVAPPGPTAMTLPCCGFSWAVSGMMMPPAVFASASIRSMTTRS